MRPRQDGCHFPDHTLKRIFLNENVIILIKISLMFVPSGPINNIPALVQIMAWCRSGGKPLTEPMMGRLSMHICVTRPQWVNQGLLHLWSKFGDLSLNGSWVIARTSKWLTHKLTHTQTYKHPDAGYDNTGRPKLALGKKCMSMFWNLRWVAILWKNGPGTGCFRVNLNPQPTMKYKYIIWWMCLRI